MCAIIFVIAFLLLFSHVCRVEPFGSACIAFFFGRYCSRHMPDYQKGFLHTRLLLDSRCVSMIAGHGSHSLRTSLPPIYSDLLINSTPSTMKTIILALLVAFLAVVYGQSNTVDNSRDTCVALGARCDDDDDCCARRGTCTFRSYSATVSDSRLLILEVSGLYGHRTLSTHALRFYAFLLQCRQFFRRGGDCDDSSNACCNVRTVCKNCKARGTQCVSDDDCCGDLDCVYRTRTAAFGTCRPDDSNDR